MDIKTGVSIRDWNDWEWQLQNIITAPLELEKYLKLTTDEKNAVQSGMRFKLTPYVLSLIINNDTKGHIRRQFIPCLSPQDIAFSFSSYDSLNEQHYEVVNNVIQKYENRVAIMTNNCCASFCQFCTRQRLMNAQNQLFDLLKAFEYINKNSEIHDVLLTGRDPLTMKNSYIKQILDKLSDIRHVDIIRIGTRVPVTLPMRIDQQLIDALCQYPALYMNIHVNHPDEITEESIKAICLLTNAGIPLGSQSVLLKHINDDADTLQKLFESLVKLKIKPYYLYQCDQENGCEHFIVSPLRGIELVNNINGRLSGLAVPRYVVDTPDIGKLVLAPCNIKSANATQLYLENYKKEMFTLQNIGK